MKPVAKIELSDEETTKQVEPLVDRFNEVTNVPILQGRLLEDVGVKEGTTTRIRHGLGRKLRGWIVVRRDVTVGIFSDDQANNKKDGEELWLILTTGSSVTTYTVNLWVF
jgi:hypothetical protein